MKRHALAALLLPAIFHWMGFAPPQRAYAQNWVAIEVRDARVSREGPSGSTVYVGTHTCEGAEPYPQVTIAADFRPVVVANTPATGVLLGAPWLAQFVEVVFAPTRSYSLAPTVIGWDGTNFFAPYPADYAGWSFFALHPTIDAESMLDAGTVESWRPTVNSPRGPVPSSFYGTLRYADDGSVLNVGGMNGPNSAIVYVVTRGPSDPLFDRVDFTLYLTRDGFWPARPAADITGDWRVDQSDLWQFLDCLFMGDTRADCNRDGAVSPQDVWEFLAAYLE